MILKIIKKIWSRFIEVKNEISSEIKRSKKYEKFQKEHFNYIKKKHRINNEIH